MASHFNDTFIVRAQQGFDEIYQAWLANNSQRTSVSNRDAAADTQRPPANTQGHENGAPSNHGTATQNADVPKAESKKVKRGPGRPRKHRTDDKQSRTASSSGARQDPGLSRGGEPSPKRKKGTSKAAKATSSAAEVGNVSQSADNASSGAKPRRKRSTKGLIQCNQWKPNGQRCRRMSKGPFCCFHKGDALKSARIPANAQTTYIPYTSVLVNNLGRRRSQAVYECQINLKLLWQRGSRQTTGRRNGKRTPVFLRRNLPLRLRYGSEDTAAQS